MRHGSGLFSLTFIHSLVEGPVFRQVDLECVIRPIKERCCSSQQLLAIVGAGDLHLFAHFTFCHRPRRCLETV